MTTPPIPVEWPTDMTPGWHLAVSGSRLRQDPDLGTVPTHEAIEQLRTMVELAETLGATRMHHGACNGWDEEAVKCAMRTKLVIIAHPPLDHRFLSQFSIDNSHLVLKERAFRDRNRDIAYEADILVGGPAFGENDPRSRRSGTWQTMRFGRAFGDRVYAVTMTGDSYDASEDTP